MSGPTQQEESQQTAAAGSTGTAATVIALIAGLGCLLPGGLCTALSLAMAFGSRNDRQVALNLALISLPCALAGFFLFRLGLRRWRRGQSNVAARTANPR